MRRDKPKFYRPTPEVLIKATQPFERLNLDFKSPLPSQTRNRYMLTIEHEYSRFPFVFHGPDMTSTKIMQCLCSLFAIFGVPAYTHSDWGASFKSKHLRQFLQERSVAVSRKTSYKPQGNGQCGRYSSLNWKTIQLVASTHNGSLTNWENLFPVALYAIRS